MSCPTHRAGLNVTATARTDRARREGHLNIVGVTESDFLHWHLDGQQRWTHESAVDIARNIGERTIDGLMCLDGVWVNLADLDAMTTYFATHPTANLARCQDCDGPCHAADRLCGICVHALTDGDN